MDPWKQLKGFTQARIGLHRVGHSLSTKDLLDFQTAHALAHSAVNKIWDIDCFEKKIKKLNKNTIRVETAVSIKEQYLKFPTLGRVLTPNSREKLVKYSKQHHTDIVFIMTDGLSVPAIDAHAIPLWRALQPLLHSMLGELKITLVLAPYGRVALSDDVGHALGAKMSVIFVGERPGLSSIDSLGIYLTYHPKKGNCDANRNCISNVHPPDGLSYENAAEKLMFLITESLRLKLSGVNLKETNCRLSDKLRSRLGLGM